MRASPSPSFGSLSRRTRRSPPTICTASPGSVRLAHAVTLRSDEDEKGEIQHICVFNVEHLLSSVMGSNVTTGKRGTLMLLVFQVSLLYPPWPLSPRMTTVSHVLHHSSNISNGDVKISSSALTQTKPPNISAILCPRTIVETFISCFVSSL